MKRDYVSVMARVKRRSAVSGRGTYKYERPFNDLPNQQDQFDTLLPPRS